MSVVMSDVREFLMSDLFVVKSSVDGVGIVTPTPVEHDKYFGILGTGHHGVLVETFPVYFSGQTVSSVYPKLSTSYGRYLVALGIVSDIVYHYVSESIDFSQHEAVFEARSQGLLLASLENIS